MRYRVFNKILISIFIVFFSVFVPINTVRADVPGPTDCSAPYDEPSPTAIVCPIIKILNVLVLSAGAAFVGVLFFSAFKFAMSQGDPKGVQGAKDTATLAVVGFIVVIGLFAIIIGVKNAFGIDSTVVNSAQGPFTTFTNGFIRLLDFAGVKNN